MSKTILRKKNPEIKFAIDEGYGVVFHIWGRYAEAVGINEHTPPHKYQELKSAFYGGIASVVAVIGEAAEHMGEGAVDDMWDKVSGEVTAYLEGIFDQRRSETTPPC